MPRGNDWINLIAARTEFVDRCDWSKFKAHDIVRIVRQCGKLGVPMAWRGEGSWSRLAHESTFAGSA